MEQLKKMTDDALVALYSEGNNQAFDVLLDRYKNKIYSYIYFIVHNEELTEDLFQETFVKAIVTIQQGRYTDNGKFSAWLTRIAHNLVIDFFRQERNENQISDSETDADLFNNIKFSEDTIEKQMVFDQILEDVGRLVEMLPENQREVVHMRYYQNLSFKEIADITGVSINTSLGRMRYALLNLRRMAEEKNIVLTVY
ncbi:MAG: sigma-70 family RNA polymerase sigma factor [Bacteroidaceae bacterium]|nr:sigma-70 family RNA polymerase sigma factor [Bacteroidaceae bacterium]